MKAVTHSAVISSLFLLVTTHILTSPAFHKTHQNIHVHVWQFMWHPVSKPIVSQPYISVMAAWWGFSPAAGLLGSVHVSACVSLTTYVCASLCVFSMHVCVFSEDVFGRVTVKATQLYTLPLQPWTRSKSCTGLPWQQQLSILVQHYYQEKLNERKKEGEKEKCWKVQIENGKKSVSFSQSM